MMLSNFINAPGGRCIVNHEQLVWKPLTGADSGETSGELVWPIARTDDHGEPQDLLSRLRPTCFDCCVSPSQGNKPEPGAVYTP